MTQVNDDAGNRIAVTVVEVGPCLVVQKKTLERDGYAALKLGFAEKREKRESKAMKGVFGKLKAKPRRMVREFRIPSEELGKFEEGQEIKVDQVFSEGQLVDVTGRTKGRGFTGVVVRWNMKGNDATHGTHEFWRHGGSIGTRTWPGWVHKNKHMAGHYGDEGVTTQNLKVVRLLTDKNCLLVEGSVPGSANGFLTIRPASTRKPKAA
jgi:large subunit ribosomal protein L3